MVLHITDLPQEILKLIVDVLQREHHSLIVPFALTYNKAIYNACRDCLTDRRGIPTKQRIICDQFFSDLKPGCTGGWNSLDLNFLPLEGTLSWLDEVARELHGKEYVKGEFEGESPLHPPGENHRNTYVQEITRIYQPYREHLDKLSLQVEAVGCDLPESFIKFWDRLHYYQCLFPSMLDYRPPCKAILHKLHPRKGVTGYFVGFLECRTGEGAYCLYLDPSPAKAHAVIYTLSCTPGLDRYMIDKVKGEYQEADLPLDSHCGLREFYKFKDRHGQTHKACHILEYDDIELLATDFETWLAGTFFDFNTTATTVDEWEWRHLVGSLRRIRYQKFIARNPRMNGYLQVPRTT